MKIPPDQIKYIITGCIIVFGAIVHSTAKLKLARESGDKFDFLDFIILIPIAMFSGLIFGLLADVLFESTQMLYISSGVGAFLGIAGLNHIANKIMNVLIDNKKLGKEEPRAQYIPVVKLL